ncbi:MAG: hypothetical protein ACTSRR_07980 [Candidatus Heimdallarchaeaceae archaeon]
MENVKIVFSVFDDTVGSRVLLSQNVSEEEAQKVSVRMLMGAAATDMLKESSAVLPLHDMGDVAYSFFFGIPCKSKRSPVTMACLTFIIPEDLQAKLYTKVPVFNYHSSTVAKQISGLILYEPSYNLDESLKQRVLKWAENLNSIMEAKQEQMGGVQTVDILRSAATPYFFMRLVNKGQESVVRELMLGRPIVVVCSKEMVKPFLSSLQSFQPRRELLVSLYPAEYVPPDQFDVLFATPELLSSYPDTLIVDLTTGVAKNGQNCQFCKELLNKLQQDAEAEKYNHKEIIDDAIRKMEEEVSKILRYSGSSIISQYYALTTNPKQQFANLTDSEIDMAFTIALARYPEYTQKIDKLYQELTGKKRKFTV